MSRKESNDERDQFSGRTSQLSEEEEAASQAAFTKRPFSRFLMSALAFLDSYRMCLPNLLLNPHY